MDGYSQAIYALDSPAGPTSRPNAHAAEVTSVAVWFLPNFLAVVFTVTLLQVLFLSAGIPRLFHDSDTGWHVRNGETILSSRSVPRADGFSYTRPGEPWFSWEWLSDATFGASHRIAGLSGVALLGAGLIALPAYGTAHLTLSLGGNLFFTAAGTVLLLGVTSMHWLARPHLFSWILALVFLSIAERERQNTTRMLWALPVFAAIWANMHASFLLGPAILFIYAVGEWIVGSPPQLRRGGATGTRLARRGGAGPTNEFIDQHHPSRGSASAVPSSTEEGNLPSSARFITASSFSMPSSTRFLIASLFSLLATFITPYRRHLHEHVFAYLQNHYLMDHIEEFRSFSFHSAGALYVEMFLVVAVLGTVALVRQRAYGPALLSLGMLHMSLCSARHIPTAAVLLLPLSIAAVTREAKSGPGLKRFFQYSERLRAIDRRIYSIVPIALVLVLACFGVNALAKTGRAGFDSVTFPVHAAEFLDEIGFHGRQRVFATDQWGGYLIYRFGGRLKVFVDGRSDFYGRNLLETYAQVIAVKPGWDGVLNQYDVRFVLVPPDRPLAAVLRFQPDWKRVYADRVSRSA